MGKRGPKPMPPEQRRVTLSLRVKPETKAALGELGTRDSKSMGEVVDALVAKRRKA